MTIKEAIQRIDKIRIAAELASDEHDKLSIRESTIVSMKEYHREQMCFWNGFKTCCQDVIEILKEQQ